MDTFGGLLRSVQQAQSKVLDFERDYAVTGAQFSVLSSVVSHVGIDQRGVVEATFIDRSTVASIVAALIERSLIASTRDVSDARRDSLSPTAEATSIVYAGSVPLQAGNAALLNPLPPMEREAFLRCLRDLAYADRRTPPERYVVPSPNGAGPELTVRWGLGRSLRGATQRYTRIWAESVDSVLTPIQYFVVDAVRSADTSGIDQRSVGELVSLDKATLTAVLGRIERRGLVLRLRDPSDGRRRLIVPTRAADELIERVDNRIRLADTAFVDVLAPSERVLFADCLRRLAHSIRNRPKGGTSLLPA